MRGWLSGLPLNSCCPVGAPVRCGPAHVVIVSSPPTQKTNSWVGTNCIMDSYGQPAHSILADANSREHRSRFSPCTSAATAPISRSWPTAARCQSATFCAQPTRPRMTACTQPVPYIYEHTHAGVGALAHGFMHACVHTCTRVCARALARARARARTPARLPARTHACTHARTHARLGDGALCHVSVH